MANDNNGMSALVSIVAVIAICAIAWYAVQLLNEKSENVKQPVIDVNLTDGNSDTSQ